MYQKNTRIGEEKRREEKIRGSETIREEKIRRCEKNECKGKGRRTHISEEPGHVHIQPRERGLHAVDHCGPVGHDESCGRTVSIEHTKWDAQARGTIKFERTKGRKRREGRSKEGKTQEDLTTHP
jgi:hypothetical protein